MSLTIWTEHGPGYRSPTFFARIAASLANLENPACYIVPSHAWKLRVEALCLAHTNGILFGNRIVTQTTWLDSLASPSTPVLSDSMRQGLLAEIISKEPLEYFRIGHTPMKQVDLLLQGITAALEANISPDALTALATDFGQEREHDLAHVYLTYIRELSRQHRTDPTQLPQLALNNIRTGKTLAAQRVIIDMGMRPIPILWEIIQALAQHPDSPDLHVVIPEHLRHTAESRLGESAREISPEEWVAHTTVTPQLCRAPNVTAQYHWMTETIRDLAKMGTPATDISLMTCDPDATLWWEACQTAGILPESALPQRLVAAPISAPWNTPHVWRTAPQTATLEGWATWWRSHLFPESRIKALASRVATDTAVCRALADIARWESVFLKASATIDAATELTARDLQTLITPLLQDQPGMSDTTLPFRRLTSDSHIGDIIPNLLVLDATQELLPRAIPSPFFKMAASFPSDPNAERLIAAYPNADTLLQIQISAWHRLCHSAQQITGIYSVSHDIRGEMAPSLFFATEAKDIVHGSTSSPRTENGAVRTELVEGRHLLHDTDTIAHVRERMRDRLFSITELEGFASCTFKHFARYILGINVPDEDYPELIAKDEGQFIHTLLEKFYSQNAQPTDEDAIRTQLIAITSSMDSPLNGIRHIQRDRLIEIATRNIVMDQMENAQRGNAALKPTRLEWNFGAHDVPPLHLTSETGATISVRGKVDRIDINPKTHRMLLVDYKLKGKVGSIISEIEKGIHLQIPLYLLAARQVFTDYTLIGGILFDLYSVKRTYGMAHKSEGEFLGIGSRIKTLLSPDDWDELLQTAERHATQYALQIQSGQFAITEHECEYCDWKGLLPWEE